MTKQNIRQPKQEAARQGREAASNNNNNNDNDNDQRPTTNKYINAPT
jgi:hypothetical protein